MGVLAVRLAYDMFWTNVWSALTAVGTLALAGATFWVTSKESRRLREERKPFVRADATNQEAFAGSGVNIASIKHTIEPQVRLVNLGNYPVHIEAAVWWTDMMRENERVIPRSQLLGLTIPPGANVVAHFAMALTISEWGWLRFYFSHGATGGEFPYIEVPLYLHPAADEGTYGMDDELESRVLFNLEKQKSVSSHNSWQETRQLLLHDNDLMDDQDPNITWYMQP